jgi:tetratricopeptide (TPR) repeat protein
MIRTPSTARPANAGATLLAVLAVAVLGLGTVGCAMSGFTQRIPFMGGGSSKTAQATSGKPAEPSKAEKKKAKAEAEAGAKAVAATAPADAPKPKQGFLQRLPFIGGSSKDGGTRLAAAEAPAKRSSRATAPEKKPDTQVARSDAESKAGKGGFMQHLPFFGGSKDGASRPDDLRSQSALQPSEPYWPYAIAREAMDDDSLANAERSLQAALARDSSYPPALALLSKVYFRSGRHAEAIQLLEAARARLDGTNAGFPPELLAGLALHYDALDRPDLAAELMGQVRKPESHGAGSARVYVVLRGESPDSADGMAKAAVDREPRSAVAQNNFGITRLRAGDPDGARRAFLAAVDLDPRLPGPYYNLAILEKFFLQDDPAAARWFKLYGERSQDDPDGLAEAFGKADAKQLSERSE